MCGRFTLNTKKEKLIKAYSIEVGESIADQLTPRFNIAPGSGIPVVLENRDTHARTLDILQWGLVPSWVKDVSISQNLSNARSESVLEKPTFRDAFLYRRCLIPASGFYEWDRSGEKKQAYYFYPRKEAQLLAFAGIWEHWSNADGSEILSVSILTKKANKDMRSIHHRMPVVLKPSVWNDWLDTGNYSEKVVDLFDETEKEGFFHLHPVSPDVNNARNDYSDLLLPYKPPEEPQLELF